MRELKTTRKQNFELLRIISMVLVTTLHYLNHAGYLSGSFSLSYCCGWLVETFSLVATDVFVIISCYFLCDKDFDVNRVKRIYIRVLLISVVGLVVSIIIEKNKITNYTNIYYFIPILSRRWGFVNNYLLFLFVFPVIKQYCNVLTKEKYKEAIVIGTIIIVVGSMASSLVGVDFIWIHHGDSVIWFLYIYFVVYYIKKFSIIISVKKAIGLWCIPPVFQWISRLGIAYITDSKAGEIKYAGVLYNGDCNPFTFLSSLGLFFIFANIKIDQTSRRTQSLIATLASATFGVYLIQEHPLLRDWFWGKILAFTSVNTMGPIVAWVSAVSLLYIVAIILDKFTGVIIKLVLDRR